MRAVMRSHRKRWNGCIGREAPYNGPNRESAYPLTVTLVNWMRM
jgi:hypothetical protein